MSPSEIASTGQTDMQVPHAMQFSPITYAIVVSFKVVYFCISYFHANLEFPGHLRNYSEGLFDNL